MLKLLAALAPMLGLLGTVTGMIETFQVITQFGNGDPKVMAGGISMALVTTVLGLVAAMPLLLAHNVLSSQAENIRNILEKQGIGLVAEQAERDMPKAKTTLTRQRRTQRNGADPTQHIGFDQRGLGLNLDELYAARWPNPMVASSRCSGVLVTGYGACTLPDNGVSEGEETAL